MATETKDREMVLTRVFDAPRELVFKAWTDPKHVVHWWGPNGFTNTILEMDVRPGGVWRFIMHGPDGKDYPNQIVFEEVVEPELLTYKHRGDAGTKPVSFDVTVIFEKLGNKTKLTMKMIFESAEEFNRVALEYGAREGAQQTLARLEEYLKETEL